MTTTPVHSITDEQIAEIEAYATSAIHSRENLGWYSSDDGCWWTGNADEGDFISSSSPSAVRAIITRLREAEKDAARYRWLRSDESKGEVDLCITKVYWGEDRHYVVLVKESADWAIDNAMQGDK